MKRIAISAGHYPAAKGAQAGDFNEYDEAVLWAAQVCRLLGSEAVLVPTGTVRQKVEYINALPDIAVVVEIHFNAAASRSAQGSETLYYPGSEAGKTIARKIQKAIACLFQPDRGVKEGWYRADKSKGPIFLLARTRAPAVIIEPEFIAHHESIVAKRDAACTVLAEALRSLL